MARHHAIVRRSPFLERDSRAPVELTQRNGDVRAAALGIIDRERMHLDGGVALAQVADDLCKLVHADLVRVAKVHGQRVVRPEQSQQPFDEVVDVTEAACLASVAIHRHRGARECLRHELRHSAAVIVTHARAKRIEDARNPDLHTAGVHVCHRERLGDPLRLVVDAARSDGIDVAPVRLRLRVHERIAVDLAGRREQNSRVLVLSQAEDIPGPERADLEGLQRMALIIDRRGKRREVQDRVDVAVDAPRAGDVFNTQAESRVVEQVADVVPAAGDQAVDADHLGPTGQQPVGEM